jgi:hypothetical protein
LQVLAMRKMADVWFLCRACSGLEFSLLKWMCYACLSILSLRMLDSGMAGNCWCQKFFSIIRLTVMDVRLVWEIWPCLVPIRYVLGCMDL